MKKIILLTIGTLFLLISTACSPVTAKYRVTVDAITAPDKTVVPTTYTIKALSDKTDAESLRFQEQVAHLKKILNHKGFKPAPEGFPAEQIIYFDYGIEKTAQRTETYVEPDITIGMSWGYPYGYRGRHYHPFYNDFWYGGRYATTYRKTYNYYNRYVTLLAKDQFNKELWRVDVSSIGESSNLRKIVPMLLEAAEDYIGKNTQEPVKLILKEKIDKKE
jgi:hypothetical protein